VNAPADDSLRAIFSGRRGRLLAALLMAEFAAAVQSIAYSTVLPIASRELHGATLYAVTLAAGSLTMIFVLAVGPGPFGRVRAVGLLAIATFLYVLGVVVAVAASAMWWVALGMAIRGVAAGLLAGFGLTAIGALYESGPRARVLGLFAVMWLLPSIVGPVLNSAVAGLWGWRGALAWPAVLVVGARGLVGRDADLIPWKRDAKERLNVVDGVLLLGALGLALSAPAAGSSFGPAALVVGVVAASFICVRVLRSQVGVSRWRLITVATMFGLTVAFFGGEAVISLAVIEGLGYGVLAAGIAVGAGATAWSLTGLRTGRVDRLLGDSVLAGLLLLGVALLVVAGTQSSLAGHVVGLAVLLVSWSVAGLGMGFAYPQVMSQTMDNLAGREVAKVATAIAFAETAGTTVGAIVSGGLYSLASAHAIPATTSVGGAFVLLSLVAFGTAVVFRRRRVYS
jgi:MFS family permease